MTAGLTLFISNNTPLSQLLLGGSHFRPSAVHLNSIFSAKNGPKGNPPRNPVYRYSPRCHHEMGDSAAADAKVNRPKLDKTLSFSTSKTTVNYCVVYTIL